MVVAFTPAFAIEVNCSFPANTRTAPPPLKHGMTSIDTLITDFGIGMDHVTNSTKFIPGDYTVSITMYLDGNFGLIEN